MSNDEAALAAVEAIKAGDFDRYLSSLWLALRERMIQVTQPPRSPRNPPGLRSRGHGPDLVAP